MIELIRQVTQKIGILSELLEKPDPQDPSPEATRAARILELLALHVNLVDLYSKLISINGGEQWVLSMGGVPQMIIIGAPEGDEGVAFMHKYVTTVQVNYAEQVQAIGRKKGQFMALKDLLPQIEIKAHRLPVVVAEKKKIDTQAQQALEKVQGPTLKTPLK